MPAPACRDYCWGAAGRCLRWMAVLVFACSFAAGATWTAVHSASTGAAPGKCLAMVFRNAGRLTLALGSEIRPVIAAMLVRLTEMAHAATTAIKKWTGWADWMVYKSCSSRKS
jgi:hypothetical protein